MWTVSPLNTFSLQPPAFTGYRGRIAPTPTGLLHLGHGRTFWTAYRRARDAQGVLIHRNEDVDHARCREEFVHSAVADLRWLGLDWEEGPDHPGPVGPYNQSERREIYLSCFERLKAAGIVYPCVCSRQDVLRAWHAPHPEEEEPRDEEPIYPGTCRSDSPKTGPAGQNARDSRVCWRFRVPDEESIRFEDGGYGSQCFVAGKDFGDFVVWTRADCPSYQLAVVIDDSLMGVTEVVRGADLLLSSARQILLYRAMGWPPPKFYHCPLVTDAAGGRMAKRYDSLSIRRLRENGATPEEVRRMWEG